LLIIPSDMFLQVHQGIDNRLFETLLEILVKTRNKRKPLVLDLGTLGYEEVVGLHHFVLDAGK